MNPWGFLFMAIGLFTAAGGIFDWDWYMNHRKSRFLISIIGRMGTRIFNTVVGLVVFGLGLAALMGAVELQPG